jgi:hypothetical protein
MKKPWIKYLFFLFAIGVMLPVDAQNTGPKEKSMKEELKTNRQLRHERREKRKLERAERKAIRDHHKRIQTKKVRKRMKESSRAANRHNEGKREFFLRRWFRKKR